jgi:WD40 repeat protein
VGVSPDGATVYVTGYSTARGTGYDYATIAYDAASGTQLWVARYDGLQHGGDLAYALEVSPDGSTVYVTGQAYDGPGVYDATTVAYGAATGAQLWVDRYPGTISFSTAIDIAVSPDGSRVFVTGNGPGDFTEEDYLTIAYDAATGRRLWVSTYDRDSENDYANAIAVSPDGTKVFVTGDSQYFESTFDYATVAYDAATGSQVWVERYDRALGVDNANAVGVSPDGSRVFVTGTSWGGDVTADDYATLAYDAASGDQLWVTRYNGPGNTPDGATALGVGPDGSRVFVAGGSGTIAYQTAGGSQLWVSTSNARTIGGLALVVSPDGSSVYVAGTTEMRTGTDWVTVSNDAATGAAALIGRLGGPWDDSPLAVAVSPDGSSVFVTGEVHVTGPSFADYETVAYAP